MIRDAKPSIALHEKFGHWVDVAYWQGKLWLVCAELVTQGARLIYSFSDNIRENKINGILRCTFFSPY